LTLTLREGLPSGASGARGTGRGERCPRRPSR
jgi:hypothetical protein